MHTPQHQIKMPPYKCSASSQILALFRQSYLLVHYPTLCLCLMRCLSALCSPLPYDCLNWPHLLSSVLPACCLAASHHVPCHMTDRSQISWWGVSLLLPNSPPSCVLSHASLPISLQIFPHHNLPCHIANSILFPLWNPSFPPDQTIVLDTLVGGSYVSNTKGGLNVKIHFSHTTSFIPSNLLARSSSF